MTLDRRDKRLCVSRQLFKTSGRLVLQAQIVSESECNIGRAIDDGGPPGLLPVEFCNSASFSRNRSYLGTRNFANGKPRSFRNCFKFNFASHRARSSTNADRISSGHQDDPSHSQWGNACIRQATRRSGLARSDMRIKASTGSRQCEYRSRFAPIRDDAHVGDHAKLLDIGFRRIFSQLIICLKFTKLTVAI